MTRQASAPTTHPIAAEPWYMTASDPAGICVYAEDGGRHTRVAVVDNGHGMGPAHGRLIAAAPELLAALTATVEHMDGMAAWLSDNGRDVLARKLRADTEQARAAIRKATEA